MLQCSNFKKTEFSVLGPPSGPSTRAEQVLQILVTQSLVSLFSFYLLPMD